MKKSSLRHRPRVAFDRNRGFEVYEWPAATKKARIRYSILLGLVVLASFQICGVSLWLSAGAAITAATMCMAFSSRFGYRTNFNRDASYAHRPLFGPYGGLAKIGVLQVSAILLATYIGFININSLLEQTDFPGFLQIGAFGVNGVDSSNIDVYWWGFSESCIVALFRFISVVILSSSILGVFMVRGISHELSILTSRAWRKRDIRESSRIVAFILRNTSMSDRQIIHWLELVFMVFVVFFGQLGCEIIVMAVQNLGSSDVDRWDFIARPAVAGPVYIIWSWAVAIGVLAVSARINILVRHYLRREWSN